MATININGQPIIYHLRQDVGEQDGRLGRQGSERIDVSNRQALRRSGPPTSPFILGNEHGRTAGRKESTARRGHRLPRLIERRAP